MKVVLQRIAGEIRDLWSFSTPEAIENILSLVSSPAVMDSKYNVSDLPNFTLV